MNKHMVFNDQFSKDVVKVAEGEIQLWQSTFLKIMTKLRAVENKLREIYGQSETPQKKINYVLKKVKEPPNDN